LNNALSLATTVFEKRERLWNQNIGTEIEYLQAKNQVESLEKSLATANTQLAKAALYAPISGSVDQVFVNQGEMAGPGAPVMRVVNLDKVQITADVSEAYVGKVEKGDWVTVAFPSMDLETKAKVTAVSQVINPNNRTFGLEVEYDNRDGKLKPNLVGLIRLRSGYESDRVMIPSRLVQSAFNGDFVYIMDTNKGMALRRDVQLGRSYQGHTVILDGLEGKELLVDGGFRNVSDSTLVVIKSL
jgi:RND family efflux transporter MFP subunit